MHLQIPGVKAFDEDVLMLVLEDGHYGDQVPIQIVTMHIGQVIDLISKDVIGALKWKCKSNRIATLCQQNCCS